eukprot:5464434-Prymnesium_polylepis.1
MAADGRGRPIMNCSTALSWRSVHSPRQSSWNSKWSANGCQRSCAKATATRRAPPRRSECSASRSPSRRLDDPMYTKVPSGRNRTPYTTRIATNSASVGRLDMWPDTLRFHQVPTKCKCKGH